MGPGLGAAEGQTGRGEQGKPSTGLRLAWGVVSTRPRCVCGLSRGTEGQQAAGWHVGMRTRHREAPGQEAWLG